MSGLSIIVGSQYDVAISNDDWNSSQSLMEARSPNAQAVGDAKQSTMDGALNQVTIPRQELVTYPVEGASGVGAEIGVGEYFCALSYQA